jgi:hypothetical protein
MCRLKVHTCYCGKEYSCSYPNFACPTLNEDEDANMCETCYEKHAEEMIKYDDEFFEDEDFSDDGF